MREIDIMTVKAIVMCKLGISVINKVIEELKQIPQVEKIMSVTGDYDLILTILVNSTEELFDVFSNKIDLIDGIIESNTHVVMKSFEK